jgi:hypothetical protein
MPLDVKQLLAHCMPLDILNPWVKLWQLATVHTTAIMLMDVKPQPNKAMDAYEL